MNLPGKLLARNIINTNSFKRIVTFSTKPFAQPNLQQTQKNVHPSKKSSSKGSDPRKNVVPPAYRFIYPEFLPDPKMEWRNPIREKLERMDMMERRKRIEIPEFYVGSILAVTSSDPHAEKKINRFVGICIHRDRCGLRARFILRNVIDHQGMEIHYDMYDPTLLAIEILRLEKRVDEHLLYLRDALPEYSTFDVNMEPEQLPDNSEVPVNTMKVTLRPRPWLERWERQNLQGIANIEEYLTDKMRRTRVEHEKPWEKFDLMKQYRATIAEQEQNEIYAEVHSQLHELDIQRRKNKRKSTFVKPIKLA